MMTQRATGDVWIKILALVTAGTEGTAARGHLEALGAMGEAAAQDRVNLQEREGEPLGQTRGVLLEGVRTEMEGMELVEGVVGVEEGGTKDKTAHPVVATTVALLAPPSALCPAPLARPATPLSW